MMLSQKQISFALIEDIDFTLCYVNETLCMNNV